ncbi:MAG TPA: MerR family transcriptional regulator [Ktedonobacterales bacterium]
MSDGYGDDRPNDETGLTIEELAERFGVSVRAIRFYIAQGLLPGPGSRGKSATYGEEHLVRLGLIRQLTERHMPLAKIQALLQGLSLDEVKTLQIVEDGLSAQLVEAERRQSPQDYVAALLDDARQARGLPQRLPHSPATPDISSKLAEKARLSRALQSPAGIESTQAQIEQETWYRWTLAPGIELHVSARARTQFSALLRALLRTARERKIDSGGS